MKSFEVPMPDDLHAAAHGADGGTRGDDADQRLRMLVSPIEESVRLHGISPEAVWLDRSGATQKGVQRCEAVFRMIGDSTNFSVLDVGCGPGLALGYLEDRYGPMVDCYLGVDISAALVAAAEETWPGYRFLVRDIIREPLSDCFDFTILNGVLTAKYSLSYKEMETLATQLLVAAWRSTTVALSFNVMSPIVDWTREDLFHWEIHQAVAFCSTKLSRHVNVIADYGLYEYTIQVFREPRRPGRVPPAWDRLSRK